MKYIYLVAVLAMTGCMTPHACEVSRQRAVGKVLLEEQQDLKEAVDHVNESWELTQYMLTSQFCKVIIADQYQIANLRAKSHAPKKTTVISLPRICGPFYEQLIKSELNKK
jgi:hypothetical protein